MTLYTAAPDAGLTGERRRRAVIQMASPLCNLGQPQQALTLLTAEAPAASDNLDSAVATFQALALVNLRGRGRGPDSVSHVPTALVARYAQGLLDTDQ